MGRSRNYDKELELSDRLKKENSQLKRENAKLRKENDRYRNLKDLVMRQTDEAVQPKKARRDWTCFECGKGTLQIHLFPRRDGLFYFRKCSTEGCGHQTKMQKHTEDVEKS